MRMSGSPLLFVEIARRLPEQHHGVGAPRPPRLRTAIEFPRSAAAGHPFQDQVAGTGTHPARSARASTRTASSSRQFLEWREAVPLSRHRRTTTRRRSPLVPTRGACRRGAEVMPASSRRRIGELRRRRKQSREPVGRLDWRAPSRRHTPRDRRRRGHRDLLAQDGPHGELEWIPGARRANAGMGSEALLQERIARQLVRDQRRIRRRHRTFAAPARRSVTAPASR